HRIAEASCAIYLENETIGKIINNEIKKGNVLTTAKIAGIMAAKNTDKTIPLCHQIQLTNIDLAFSILENKIEIFSKVECIDKTGAEIEALHSVLIAALTIYDMCKAVDKKMVIGEAKLCQKSKLSV
ncbi:MAG TPA: cyclic pyranopterin monophosphate synthase MoaC, partial [Spirochaetota bacterium]|nr:cyclic pyranopterin monophosphate synthase MoaC [Spirochaetota bacterium]